MMGKDQRALGQREPAALFGADAHALGGLPVPCHVGAVGAGAKTYPCFHQIKGLPGQGQGFLVAGGMVIGRAAHEEKGFAVGGFVIGQRMPGSVHVGESTAVGTVIVTADQIVVGILGAAAVQRIAQCAIGRGKGIEHPPCQRQTAGLGVVDLHIQGDAPVKAAVFLVQQKVAGPEWQDAFGQIPPGPFPQAFKAFSFHGAAPQSK